MINPNIYKYVLVKVEKDIAKNDLYATAEYRGYKIDVVLRDKDTLKAGTRRLYLKYSICNDRYWLTDRA
jgi:hypothetical protein